MYKAKSAPRFEIEQDMSPLQERGARFKDGPNGRTRRAGNQDLTTREPRIGASGRYAALDPLNEKPLPTPQPLSIPPKSARRLSLPLAAAQGKRSLPLSDVSSHKHHATKIVGSLSEAPEPLEGHQVRPIVPLKTRRNSPPRYSFQSPWLAAKVLPKERQPSTAQEPENANRDVFELQGNFDGRDTGKESRNDHEALPSVDSRVSCYGVFKAQSIQPLSRLSWPTAPTGGTVKGQKDSPTLGYGAAPRISRITDVRQSTGINSPTQMHANAPPISRFSATTAATEGTIYQALDTPNAVLPSSPVFEHGPARVPSEAAPRSRKPVSVVPSFCASQASSPITVDPTSKALPLSPAQLASCDLITSLQAELDERRNRRHNLQKLVRNLSGGGPQNSILLDSATRKMKEHQAEAFKLELAEVERGSTRSA